MFFVDLCIDDHGSFLIYRPASVRPIHLFDRTSTMITNSILLYRERDAQSSARRTTPRHVRFRAVPRTNRTLTTAKIHHHSATSSTTESPTGVPSRPWQCFCVDASPGVCIDVASQDGCALLPGLEFYQQEAQQRTALLADVPQALLASTGVLTRYQPNVGANLLAAFESRRRSDDQHKGECRKRTHARMCHKPQNFTSLPGFPLDRCS